MLAIMWFWDKLLGIDMLRSKLLLTAVIAIGLSGCGGSANTHEKAPISASPKHGQGETASTTKEQGRDLIRAGYGTALVHLGQPVEELRDGWVKVADEHSNSDMPYLDNKNQGIEIEYEDGKVRTVFFTILMMAGHRTDMVRTKVLTRKLPLTTCEQNTAIHHLSKR